MKALTPFFVKVFGSNAYSVGLLLSLMFLFFFPCSLVFDTKSAIAAGMICAGFVYALLDFRYARLAAANNAIGRKIARMESLFEKNPSAIYGDILSILNDANGQYSLLFTNGFLIDKFFSRLNTLIVGFINHSDDVATLHVIDVAEALDACNHDQLIAASTPLRKMLGERKKALELKLTPALRLGDYLSEHLIDLDRYLLGGDRVNIQLVNLINRCDRKELLLSAKRLLLMPEDEVHEVLEAFVRSAG